MQIKKHFIYWEISIRGGGGYLGTNLPPDLLSKISLVIEILILRNRPDQELFSSTSDM